MKAPIHHIVSIDGTRLNELISNAESTSEECCGFLLGYDRGSRVITTVVPTANVSTIDRRIRFEVDPLEYLKAEKYAAAVGLELLGIYHSHPNTSAIPSETDRREAQPFFSYVIISLSEQQFADIRSWRLNPIRQFEEEIIIHGNLAGMTE